MSAQSQPDLDMASVSSIRGFLLGFLDEALTIDRQLHQAIEHLRVRVHALELAEDPQFVHEHKEFSEAVSAGKYQGASLTAEEFAARYKSA
jgi:hypothetical protein